MILTLPVSSRSSLEDMISPIERGSEKKQPESSTENHSANRISQFIQELLYESKKSLEYCKNNINELEVEINDITKSIFYDSLRKIEKNEMITTKNLLIKRLEIIETELKNLPNLILENQKKEIELIDKKKLLEDKLIKNREVKNNATELTSEDQLKISEENKLTTMKNGFKDQIEITEKNLNNLKKLTLDDQLNKEERLLLIMQIENIEAEIENLQKLTLKKENELINQKNSLEVKLKNIEEEINNATKLNLEEDQLKISEKNELIENKKISLKNYENKAREIKEYLDLTKMIESEIMKSPFEIDSDFKKEEKIKIISQAAEEIINLEKKESLNKFNNVVIKAQYEMKLLDNEEKSFKNASDNYTQLMEIIEKALSVRKENIIRTLSAFTEGKNEKRDQELKDQLELTEKMYNEYFPRCIPNVKNLTSVSMIDTLEKFQEDLFNLVLFTKYLETPMNGLSSILTYQDRLSIAKNIANLEENKISKEYKFNKKNEVKALYKIKQSDAKKINEIYNKFAKNSLKPNKDKTFFNYSLIKELNIAEANLVHVSNSYNSINKELINKIIKKFNKKIKNLKNEQLDRNQALKKFEEANKKHNNSIKLPSSFEFQKTSNYKSNLENLTKTFSETKAKSETKVKKKKDQDSYVQ